MPSSAALLDLCAKEHERTGLLEESSSDVNAGRQLCSSQVEDVDAFLDEGYPKLAICRPNHEVCVACMPQHTRR